MYRGRYQSEVGIGEGEHEFLPGSTGFDFQEEMREKHQDVDLDKPAVTNRRYEM